MNLPKKIAALLTITLAVGSLSVTKLNAQEIKLSSASLVGESRFETAIKISTQGWSSSSEVIIVNDESIADALSATPFAKVRNIPILLTNKSKLDSNTKEELKRLGVKKAYLIGGTSVLDEDLENQIKKEEISIERICGEDRYLTSLELAKKLNNTKKISQIAIVNGEKGLADAVSVGSPAAQNDMPIILSNQKQGTKVADEFIKSQSIKQSYIIGGESVISKEIENKLPNSKRLGGIDRNETNARVVEEFYKSTKLKNAYLAKNGMVKQDQLIDALAVGVLAAKNESPVILVGNKLDISQKSLLNTKSLEQITQIGGKGNENAFNELRKDQEIEVYEVKNIKELNEAINKSNANDTINFKPESDVNEELNIKTDKSITLNLYGKYTKTVIINMPNGSITNNGKINKLLVEKGYLNQSSSNNSSGSGSSGSSGHHSSSSSSESSSKPDVKPSIYLKNITINKGSKYNEIIISSDIENAKDVENAKIELFTKNSQNPKYTAKEVLKNGKVTHIFKDVEDGIYVGKVTIKDQSLESSEYFIGQEKETLQEVLLSLPTSLDASGFEDKEKLLKTVNDAKLLTKQAQREGTKNEEIEKLQNYNGIGYALSKIDRILFEFDYMFGFIREDGAGSYADVSLKDKNTININVIKNERIGEIFDGHHLGEYIREFGNPPLFKPDKLNIANIDIIPEPSGSDSGMGITSATGKRNILYAFAKLAQKQSVSDCTPQTNPISDTYLNDIIGTSIYATYKGEKYTINFTSENANKDMLNREIRTYKKLPIGYYTEESESRLAKAMNKAMGAVAKENSTHDEINEAYKTLKKAQDELEHIQKNNKQTLKELVKKARNIEKGAYLKSLYNTVSDNADYAQTVIDNDKSTEREIGKATDKINYSIREYEIGKMKINAYKSALNELPEVQEQADKLENVSQVQALMSKCISTELAARTFGISNKDIEDIKSSYSNRDTILNTRLQVMNQGYKIIDEVKYFLIPDYVTDTGSKSASISIYDNNINLATREIEVNILNGSTLLSDILKGNRLVDYQKDNKDGATYPSYLKIGDVVIDKGLLAIAQPNSKTNKQIHEALVKLTKAKSYESIYLSDLKDKEIEVEFPIISNGKNIKVDYKVKFNYKVNKVVLTDQVQLARSDKFQDTKYFKDIYKNTLLKTLNNQILDAEDLLDHFTNMADGEKEERYEKFIKALSDCRMWNDKFEELEKSLSELPKDKIDANKIAPRAANKSDLSKKVKNIESIITTLKNIGVTDELLQQIKGYNRISISEKRLNEISELITFNQNLAKLPKSKEDAAKLNTDEKIKKLKNDVMICDKAISYLKEKGIRQIDIEGVPDFFRLNIANYRLKELDKEKPNNSIEIKNLVVSKEKDETQIKVSADINNAKEKDKVKIELIPEGANKAFYKANVEVVNGKINYTFENVMDDTYIVKLTIKDVSVTLEE
ncbi:cell wall-binding repeat-containing protein [Romboutsia maritimum]|uniref:Cell wall-binding repeat-containing protein n=1 Tax=Romboutsia maritimum TaxID=2020948 RepID=A0A371IQN7_9FIRM|nr:cell wall-binding repeat-containing protein [Romboutsia maritimum]RDY22799.1 cell wall-binding repeat-containing protein [Romboutsia maritimum]